MQVNMKLLAAIREAGYRQRDFAGLVGEHESQVSMVINGRLNLDEKRKAMYAKVLDKSVQELFTG